MRTHESAATPADNRNMKGRSIWDQQIELTWGPAVATGSKRWLLIVLLCPLCCLASFGAASLSNFAPWHWACNALIVIATALFLASIAIGIALALDVLWWLLKLGGFVYIRRKQQEPQPNDTQPDVAIAEDPASHKSRLESTGARGRATRIDLDSNHWLPIVMLCPGLLFATWVLTELNFRFVHSEFLVPLLCTLLIIASLSIAIAVALDSLRWLTKAARSFFH